MKKVGKTFITVIKPHPFGGLTTDTSDGTIKRNPIWQVCQVKNMGKNEYHIPIFSGTYSECFLYNQAMHQGVDPNGLPKGE